MSRPAEVDLTVPGAAWRAVPMPSANLPLALTRLDSADGAFVIHGRFPAGFTRDTPGGYAVAEEFLVLDGDMTIEGTTYVRGDLTHLPANLLRSDMRTTAGCTVLAWFGGPAIFHQAAHLVGAHSRGIRSVHVLGAAPGPLLDVAGSHWVVATDGGRVPSGRGDVVAADLSRWRRAVPGVAAAAGDLVRTEGGTA